MLYEGSPRSDHALRSTIIVYEVWSFIDRKIGLTAGTILLYPMSSWFAFPISLVCERLSVSAMTYTDGSDNKNGRYWLTELTDDSCDGWMCVSEGIGTKRKTTHYTDGNYDMSSSQSDGTHNCTALLTGLACRYGKRMILWRCGARAAAVRLVEWWKNCWRRIWRRFAKRYL